MRSPSQYPTSPDEYELYAFMRRCSPRKSNFGSEVLSIYCISPGSNSRYVLTLSKYHIKLVKIKYITIIVSHSVEKEWYENSAKGIYQRATNGRIFCFSLTLPPQWPEGRNILQKFHFFMVFYGLIGSEPHGFGGWKNYLVKFNATSPDHFLCYGKEFVKFSNLFSRAISLWIAKFALHWWWCFLQFSR